MPPGCESARDYSAWIKHFAQFMNYLHALNEGFLSVDIWTIGKYILIHCIQDIMIACIVSWEDIKTFLTMTSLYLIQA